MTARQSILVADDDPGVLDVVAFMLRREGFDVDEQRTARPRSPPRANGRTTSSSST